MEMSVSYIADHYAVLRVKKENGIDCDKELQVFEKELAKHWDLDRSKVEELYEINKAMWPLHDIIVDADSDAVTVANLSVELLKLNGKRVRVRSEIARKYGEFEEYKTYE